MAQRVVTTYTDDIDGSDIEDGKGGTVSFALDGKNYAIDLTAKNADKLRKSLKPYIDVAKSGSARSRKTSSATTTIGPSARELRDWARQNGFDVPARGRIPNEVREAYDSKS